MTRNQQPATILNIFKFNLVIICRYLNFTSILSLFVFNLGDLSLNASITPNFLDAKIGGIKFYCFRGLSIVRESPCKILHNRKSSRNMDKLKFSQLQKDIFLEQKQMKGWLSDH